MGEIKFSQAEILDILVALDRQLDFWERYVEKIQECHIESFVASHEVVMNTYARILSTRNKVIMASRAGCLVCKIRRWDL